MKVEDILYHEQQRRKTSGSFGYGDFGIRRNEDLYGMGESDADDIARGQAIMAQFYTSYTSAYGQPAFSLNEFLAKYATPANGNLLSLGLSAIAAGMTDAQTQTAMDSLVGQGGGKLPADWNPFVAALSNQATQVSWIDAANFAVAQLPNQFQTGVTAIAQSAQSIFSNPITYLVAAALLYGYVRKK